MTVDAGLSELPQAKPQEKSPKNTFEKAKTHLTSAKDTLRSWVGKKDSASVQTSGINTESKYLVESLPNEIPAESVYEATDIIQNLSMWSRSQALLFAGRDKVVDLATEYGPMGIVGSAVFALENVSSIKVDSVGARLLMTMAVGGAAAIDGRELRESLLHPSKAKLTKSLALAMIFSSACDAVGLPLSSAVKGIADDALVVPLLAMSKNISVPAILRGGVK